MALIPTLSLFGVEGKKFGEAPADTAKWIRLAVGQLNAYNRAHGQILFGTDVGYTDLFPTNEEFRLLQEAGMDFPAILASLTTEPAKRFRFSRRGKVEPGFDGDLVVLSGDPAHSISAFSRVRYTIRAGHLIFDSMHPSTADAGTR